VGVGVTRKLFTGLKVNCAYSPTNFDPNNVTENPIDLPKLVGGMGEESEVLAMQLYETVYNSVIRTGSPEVAEAAVMLKRAKQTMEDALMNEFADYCDTVPNLDIHEVIDATTTGNRDPRTALPWIGRTDDVNSRHLMSTKEELWPVLSVASAQLCARPLKIYNRIVDRYCGGKFDKLHKMAFLIVGVGAIIGSPDIKDSPVLDIIRHLELEGALVVQYDMFIKDHDILPEMKHNSGRNKFDGILVMHPYNASHWDKYKETMYFCKH
jgi:UDP-N-acetyl-D-glucosamine dehydrogenase